MEKLPTADPRKVLAAWVIEKIDAEAADNQRRVARANLFIDRLYAKHGDALPSQMDGFDAWCVLNDLPMADEDGIVLD